MRYFLVFSVIAILSLTACNDDPGEEVWEDGTTLWLSGAYADTALSWSPHGDVLYFSTYGDGAARIFAADGINTPSERTFTGLDEFVGPTGAWSGENLRIVYTALNADSSWGQIRSQPGNDIYPTTHVHDSLPNAFPTYNTAGDSILYCGMATGNWQFYKISYKYTPDSEGSPVLQTEFPQGDLLRPSYSPDNGTWILFQQRASSSDDWDIMVAHPDGSDQRVLAENSADDIHPTWGPNENWVAFSSNRTGNYEIFLAPVNGDTLIQVTDDPAMDKYPAWNPEKGWIAFSSDRVSESWNLDIFAISEPDLPW